MVKNKISWTDEIWYPIRSDATWNPITGCCSKSKGCLKCYAREKEFKRYENDTKHPKFKKFKNKL